MHIFINQYMGKFLLCIICICLGNSAWANMAAPAEIKPYIHSNVPYGEGTYSKFMIDAYDAAIWTDAKEWSMEIPFALSLKYRMHFTSKDIVGRSLEEMNHVEPLTKEQVEEYNQILGKLIPDVSPGDVITAVYMPGKWEDFYYNGKKTGRIESDALARHFLAIWLSPKTSAPNLRNNLIKGN
jgi:hypothetical protein